MWRNDPHRQGDCDASQADAVSRAEGGCRSRNLGPLLCEVRDVLRILADKKNISIAVDAGDVGKVVTDAARLKQVVYNCMSNAMKFTNDGGRIAVEIRPDGDHFRIAVQDTGIGIRTEDLSRLFVEFQQLDSGTSKKYQGAGLGLALTKRIAEAQGGHVEVESTFGEGSTFSVVLPRRLSP